MPTIHVAFFAQSKKGLKISQRFYYYKHMKIKVYSRKEIESWQPPQEKYVLISIKTPGDQDPTIQGNSFMVNKLTLAFDDVDELMALFGQELFGRESIMFNKHMANQIVNLLQTSLGFSLVVIHCDAGISRSAGVAAAISQFFIGSVGEFFGKPIETHEDIFLSKYHPNQNIYDLLLKAFQESDMK